MIWSKTWFKTVRRFGGAFLPVLMVFGAFCAADMTAYAGSLTLVDTEGKPILDAVLSLVPLTTQALPAPKSGVINQIDENFVPKVSVVQTGAEILFKNDDRTRHHIYSYSPAKQFETQVPPKTADVKVTFDKPGTIALGCNIHDRMLAFLIVVDTPYFGKSNNDGVADFQNLPDGNYKAVIWHARLKAPNSELSQDVKIVAGQIQNFAPSLSLKPERRGPAEAEKGNY
jgi:plastocyanin